MKLKPKFLPHIAAGAGILALGLRLWLLLTGIDGRGLVVDSHPASLLSYLLIVPVLALVFLLTRKVPGTPPYSKLFKRSLPACIGSWAAALGILVDGIVSFFRVEGYLGVLTGIAGIAAAGCLVLIGVCRAKPLRPAWGLHGAVAVFMMLRTLSQYQSWNTEPQLQRYFPQLLACVFLMIAAYYRTALDAGQKERQPFLFFNHGAVFFCLWAAAGSEPLFYGTMALWAATSGCSTEPHISAPPMELPKNVQLCLTTLTDNGHSAYVVGGCVRDHLLGLTPHDYDMCTDAKPERIAQLFSNYNLVRSGEKHGTIGVIMDGEVYEITTFRTEGDYTDSRHPGWVKFVDSLKDDLARRDFTVNAMAYSPKRGYADPFGGQQDLENGILRAVGDPETRFTEDALRILRGVRFAARFGLKPEKKTLEAMRSCTPLMEQLAAERVLAELLGMLPHLTAQDLQTYRPILLQVIPEMEACVDFDQHNPHHIYDVYTHIAHTVENVPADPALRLAALLHDIGKPRVFTRDEKGIGHFYGHAKVSAEIADGILHRLKVSNAMREQVLFLIENHMVLPEADKKFLRHQLGKYGHERYTQLLALQSADLMATGTRTEEALEVYEKLDGLIREILQEDSCLSQKDLAVNGRDLLLLGFLPGPKIGQCLSHLLERVLDETLPNEKNALLEAAKTFLQEGESL